MQIRLIAATDEDMGIGKDNKIPWHNRSDLQHFARTTIEKCCINGKEYIY